MAEFRAASERKGTPLFEAQCHNDIRDLRAQGKTQREIAEQLGISPATVCKVLKR